jgi:DNA-binding GntR family transcriptional regulator
LSRGGSTSSHPSFEATRSNTLTPVARSSLSDEVVKKLRREILLGNIKPGERILEQEISAVMRTSRGPVRDALIQLEHEGLVVREPNRSAVVVSMSVDDVEEVCSLRLSLESLALRYALDRAQDEDFSRMHAAVDAQQEALKADNSLQRSVDLDLRFHEAYVTSARHNRVLSMWESIKPQIWFLIFSRNAFAIENFEESVRSHRQLVEDIRAKNVERARENLQEHLNVTYENLIAQYTKIHSADEELA